ncbi:MAG: glycosyltransferase [Sphingomonadales bacterium]
MSDLPVIKSLWIGPALSRLERLSLLSFVAAGHEVQLFTYGPLDVPEGITVRDGRDILPEDAIIRRRRNGGIEPFADLFRYVLIGMEGGIWVDTDQVCLKPFDFTADRYVMGWQGSGLAANGVYGAPRESAMARHLLAIGRDPPRLPVWAGSVTMLRVIAGVATGGNDSPADAPWGTYGPALFTAAVRKFGLEGHVQPPDVFYPLPWPKADLLFEEPWRTEERFTERTLGIHLWNHMIGHRKKEPFPQGSYLAALARRFL